MDSNALTLDLFTKTNADFESSQYQVLAGLKDISREFKQNRIYPHLSLLIKLESTLRDILKRLRDLRDEFPKRIKKIDFVNETIEHEVVFVPGADLKQVENLIAWALPYIVDKIEEGRAIFEFVDEELELEEVGIVPDYTDEGYLFVPDNETGKLLVFQYEVSVFKSSEDTYRSLKTAFLEAVHEGGVHHSPNAIKLDLISKNRKLPNPATYAFNTRLSFPFEETIFPVTKRKLMRNLCVG